MKGKVTTKVGINDEADLLKSVTEEDHSQQDEYKSNPTSQVITVDSDMSSFSDQDIPQMPLSTSG